ncbi:replication initiator protein A [Bacillus mycoides]|uniref:replication initiator protein A n=1 Tax=Bacillus mycoides TaxID=1405 RepID=UPI0021129266|nr:replication initiator protein A [Bacillus mycoides]MCQ6527472.1 replication initiator protein A [Bacillus mycoides]
MKQYITQGYVDKLRDKEQKTGVYYSTPKVIYKGEKYRTKLSLTQKAIYQELYDISMKALHDNQVDSKGNVYIEVSYIFIATALDISEGTVRNNMNGKGKDGKYTELFDLGLLKIKKRKDRETSQYYVMAPNYEGNDAHFLEKDYTTSEIRLDAKERVAKKNRTNSKRENENEQLEDERMFDTKADTADYQLQEKQFNDSLPDGVKELPPEPQETIEEQPTKETYFRVFDKQDYDGTYIAEFVIAQNGKVIETWSIDRFLKETNSTIVTNRHVTFIMKDIESEGKYEIKYEI